MVKSCNLAGGILLGKAKAMPPIASLGLPLQDVVTMFGMPWTISTTLYSYLKHEIHHRGQLTILMRQAGLPVIGAYGPAKEQWAAIGMPVPAL